MVVHLSGMQKCKKCGVDYAREVIHLCDDLQFYHGSNMVYCPDCPTMYPKDRIHTCEPETFVYKR